MPVFSFSGCLHRPDHRNQQAFERQMELSYFASLASIVWLDIVLSGDNALVIGIAASTLPAELRRKAILFGLGLATTIRILFAGATTYMLNIPGLLFAGGLALLWVSWSLLCEIRCMARNGSFENCHEGVNGLKTGNTLFRALVSITVADISMSIDNILAVAALARGHLELLAIGLGLSIALMGIGATLVMRVLVSYRWISFVGVFLLVFIGGRMIWNGWPDFAHLIAETVALLA